MGTDGQDFAVGELGHGRDAVSLVAAAWYATDPRRPGPGPGPRRGELGGEASFHRVPTEDEGTIGQLDGIGYTIDRIANRVGISARNRAKAFHAVWSIGNGKGN